MHGRHGPRDEHAVHAAEFKLRLGLTAWDLRDDPDAAVRRIQSLLERALEEALTPRE